MEGKLYICRLAVAGALPGDRDRTPSFEQVLAKYEQAKHFLISNDFQESEYGSNVSGEQLDASFVDYAGNLAVDFSVKFEAVFGDYEHASILRADLAGFNRNNLTALARTFRELSKAPKLKTIQRIRAYDVLEAKSCLRRFRHGLEFTRINSVSQLTEMLGIEISDGD